MSFQEKYRLKGKSKDFYLKLMLDFPLASIKNDERLSEAQKFMDSLLARGTLNKGEGTHLDALSDLVDAYEDEHHAIEPASDAKMLQHLLDAKRVTRAQLCLDADLPKSMISEVLKGKKRFSRQMIHQLAQYFHVDASSLAAYIRETISAVPTLCRCLSSA